LTASAPDGIWGTMRDGDDREPRPRVDWRTVGFVTIELAACLGVVSLALAWWHPVTVVLAMGVIATRQHALFILFHDAVHYNVARDKRLNDLITNALIGLPQLVPVQLYRRLHLAHHARLGREDDPERLLLYRDQPWQYRPLALSRLIRQVLGDVFLINNLKTLWHFQAELQGDRLCLPAARTWPEFWVLVATYGGLVVAGCIAVPDIAWKVALLWIVPLLTLTQAIQKVRSFLEHAPMDAGELTYSWRPGWLGRLIVWPYHINYHREHHLHPKVPWHALPQRFAGSAPTRVAWWRVLWNGRWWPAGK
jgi:fatty acid desaturase